MKKLWAIGLVVLAFAFSAQLSFAQQNAREWLIGKWEGTLQNYSGQDGAGRIMKVTLLVPEGSAQGMWAVIGTDMSKAQIRPESSQVRLVTGADSIVDLTRKGDERLEGTDNLKNRQAFPLTLAKVEPSPESTWACGAPVSAPTYQAGDNWTWRDAKGAEWSNTVVQVEGDVTQIRRPPGGDVAFFDKDWVIQQVMRANGELITQQAPGPYAALHQKVLDFPLQVGKTWSNSFRGTDSGIPITIPIWRKILSCEEISTPAGKLQALKIESTFTFPRGRLTLHLWYAPQAKQFVRLRYISSGNTTYNWNATSIDNELIRFDVR